MGKIRLIIGREYLSRVRKPSFLIMTILGPVLVAAFFGLVTWVGLQESVDHKVLVVDEHGYTPLQFKSVKGITFYETNQDISDSAFEASVYTDLIYINEELFQNDVIQVVYKKAPSQLFKDHVRRQVGKSIRRWKMEFDNVDPEVYERVDEPIDFQFKDLFSETDSAELEKRAALGFGFSLLIFMFIFVYGVQVMRGVIEEKTNRIVEVLSSSVKPFQLMMGKVIGIMFVGLTQFTLWVILSSVLISVLSSTMPELSNAGLSDVQYSTELAQQIPQAQVGVAVQEGSMLEFIYKINWPLLISSFFFYFIGGYLLYGSLFAAVGSAVDGESDTQQFLLPISMPLMFSYMIGIMVMTNPDGPAAVWCSYIPFTSPVIMLIRISTGVVMWWEVLISMAILVSTFIGTTWVAGRIYRTGILMYGKKPSWKEMWKWLRY